ncbi:M15 family metallopeptidase [Amycolatopsis sp. cmx-4-54]|uniref:M15 family metallopeptidase n=1 Tax=Amycolatopsis sp. cmx-4-54 TaxID=2790936 RepID=UPI00397B3871
MATSQNGYTANDRRLVSSRLVPGTTRKLTVRNGPSGDLLLWVAAQFDKLIEDIEQGILDDWGYAERPIRGGVELSNHASGTAIDLNATSHPLGTQPTANFSASEIAGIRAIVARTEGCVRWGGDYTGRKDSMHFEINAPESRCAVVLHKLNTSGGGGATPTKPTTNSEDFMAQGAAGKGQISIPTNGLRSFYCLIGGKSAKVTGRLYYIGDTPPGTGARYLGEHAVNFDADRPGPFGIPEGVRGVTFFYDATAPFAAWCV